MFVCVFVVCGYVCLSCVVDLRYLVQDLAPTAWKAALSPCLGAALPKLSAAEVGKIIVSLLEQCSKDVQIDEAKVRLSLTL